MSDQKRIRLRRKYLSLGTGELTAAVTFAVVAVFSVARALDTSREVAALWWALTPLLIILTQAGVYWLLARAWVERSPMPPAVAATFWWCRVLNVGVLIGGLVGVLVWLPSSPFTAVAIVGVWLFGVIEYLNYFVVRLSYPPRRFFRDVGQWRTPRLMQDVNAGRKTG